MKQRIVSVLAVGLLFFASCTKNDVHPGDVEKKPEITVEKGVLAFKSYAAFFSALSAQSSLKKEDRLKWEKEIGFTSMRTQYERFNEEVALLDKSATKAEDYDNNKFLQIVARYKSALDETKEASVYNLNSSGLLESGLINEKGIVKVENDYIYFGKSQIVTFINKTSAEVLNLVGRATKFKSGQDKTIQVNSDPAMDDPFAQLSSDTIPEISGKLMSAGNEVMNISSVAIPGGLRFAVRNQAWNVAGIGSNSAKGYGRIRLFAIALPNNSIRGFVTLQMYTTARNWLGITRKINIVGWSLHGQVDLIIQPQFAHNLINMTGNDGSDPTFSPAPEDWETVILASKKLKEDATILATIPGIPYANQSAMANVPNVLNDDYLDTGSQWWGNVFTNGDYTTLITNTFQMHIIAIGNGPFAGNYNGYVNLTNGNE